MVGHTDDPPAYEFVAGQGPSQNVQSPLPPPKQQPKPPAPTIATPRAAPAPVMPQPRVYHYHNPATGEHLASFLPPDHPEMLCLQQGGHIAQTKFGILGVLAAIVWFPLGISFCLLDRRVICKRCGVVIDDAICG